MRARFVAMRVQPVTTFPLFLVLNHATSFQFQMKLRFPCLIMTLPVYVAMA